MLTIKIMEGVSFYVNSHVNMLFEKRKRVD
jgi:hypothetical protein